MRLQRSLHTVIPYVHYQLMLGNECKNWLLVCFFTYSFHNHVRCVCLFTSYVCFIHHFRSQRSVTLTVCTLPTFYTLNFYCAFLGLYALYALYDIWLQLLFVSLYIHYIPCPNFLIFFLTFTTKNTSCMTHVRHISL